MSVGALRCAAGEENLAPYNYLSNRHVYYGAAPSARPWDHCALPLAARRRTRHLLSLAWAAGNVAALELAPVASEVLSTPYGSSQRQIKNILSFMIFFPHTFH